MKLSGALGFVLVDCLLGASDVCAFQTTAYARRIAVAWGEPRREVVVSLASSSNDDEPPISSATSLESADNQKQVQAQPTETTETETTRTTAAPSQPQLQSTRQQGPTAQDLMMALGTSPRRIFTSFASATAIALGGNFLGVTSRLLTTMPEEQVEAIGIDTYFPRGNYKRCRTQDYTFVVPKEWVADTFVELAKAQRKIQPLDYSMQKTNGNSGGGRITTLPDSAYGPPGRLNQNGVSQAGDTNVSVIVSSGFSGFTLGGTLGSPTDAAQTLLSRSIAPEGSGRVATLLRAVEDKGGQTYQFEYIVDRGTRGPPLRNIAVIAASPRGDKLYTLTVVAPVEKWKDEDYDSKLRKIADSFHLR